MKKLSFIIAILATLFINVANSQSIMTVKLTTGGDDLRSGNTAYITVNYSNGTTSKEYSLGGGFANNSFITKNIRLDRLLSNTSEISYITIRHDGAPRAGNPFDTYDNWDLQILRVTLVMPNGTEQNIINSSGNPLKRFTGAIRTLIVDKIR